MKKFLLILFGKSISTISRALNLGNGSTWPGHVAIENYPCLLSELEKEISSGSIIIAGTNGKTTTSKMIRSVLEKRHKTIHNDSGANLLNGIASSLIRSASIKGKIDAELGIFEVDENTLPLLIDSFTPKIVVLLNLFRDQLDRYGEVDAVAAKWKKALHKLPSETTVILNADDPQIAFLGRNLKAKTIYFGLNDSKLFAKSPQHATDSTYCPNCGEKLKYKGVYFSHLGIWNCTKCMFTRPQARTLSIDSPLPGNYNLYNTLAAQVVLNEIGIKDEVIKKNLIDFKPAFGRQEEIKIGDKKAILLLSKNPTGFNESIRTLNEFSLNKKNVMLILNDRIPDGTDISWIWDVDFENLKGVAKTITVSGDRTFDMALRIKYSEVVPDNKLFITENLGEAIQQALRNIKAGETLYVLLTYSAMLEARKILKGKKIL